MGNCAHTKINPRLWRMLIEKDTNMENGKKGKITVDDPSLLNGERVTPKGFSYKITIKQGDETIKVITVYPGLYWWIVILYAFFIVSVGLLAYWYDTKLMSEPFTWGGGVISFCLLHLVLSITYLEEDKIGGLLFFGRPIRQLDQGPVFRPLGILQLVKFQRSPVQKQFPADPERIFKGTAEGKSTDDTYFALPKTEQDRYVLPIRALTGGPERQGEKDEDILNSQMTLEVNFFVRYSIEHYWVFLIRIGSIEEANRQLRDSGERVIIQAVAERTPKKVVAELTAINEELRVNLEENTEDWGVYVIEAAMLSPDLTHEVNKAMRNVIVKKAEAQQVVVGADAEKIRLTRVGEGEAAALTAQLVAMGDGAKALNVDGGDILDLEKARAFANGKTTVFIDGGGQGASLLGIGARLAAGGNEALKQLKE